MCSYIAIIIFGVAISRYISLCVYVSVYVSVCICVLLLLLLLAQVTYNQVHPLRINYLAS